MGMANQQPWSQDHFNKLQDQTSKQSPLQGRPGKQTPSKYYQPRKPSNNHRLSARGTLFICNLPAHITVPDLQKLLSPKATILDAYLPSKPNSSGKWYGFVKLRNSEIASRSILALNGSTFQGRRLSVHFANGPLRTLATSNNNIVPPKQNSAPPQSKTPSSETSAMSGQYTLFIGNISPYSTQQHLRRAFSRYCTILQCSMVRGSPGKNKSYSFITVESALVANRVLTDMRGYKEFDRSYLGY